MNVLITSNQYGQGMSPRGCTEISADSELSTQSEKFSSPAAMSTARLRSSHHSATVTPVSKSKDGVSRIGMSLSGRSLHLLFKRTGSSRYLHLDSNDVEEVSIADFSYGDRKLSSSPKDISKEKISSSSSPRRKMLTLGVGCLSLHFTEPTVAASGNHVDGEVSDSLSDSYDGFSAASMHHGCPVRAEKSFCGQHHDRDLSPRTPATARSFVNALSSSPSAAATFRVRRRRSSMPYTGIASAGSSSPALSVLGTTCHWIRSPGSDRPHLEFSPDLPEPVEDNATDNSFLPKVSLLDDDAVDPTDRVADVADGEFPGPSSPRLRCSMGSDSRDTATGSGRMTRHTKARRRHDHNHLQVPRRHSATAVTLGKETGAEHDCEQFDVPHISNKEQPLEPRLSRMSSTAASVNEAKSPSSSPRRKTRRTATHNHFSIRRRSSMQHLHQQHQEHLPVITVDVT